MSCCRRCRQQLLDVVAVRVAPEPCPPAMPPTWAGTTYSGTAALAIKAWKDGDQPHLGVLLLPLLAGAVRRAVAESPQWRQSVRRRPVLAIPVPSRPSGTRHRGRFPVYDLVRALLPRAEDVARPMPALSVSSAVRDQAGLGRQARARNLDGAMRVRSAYREHLRGAPILLVDDVVTTGATVAEAARALSGSGAGPVIAVTVAATARHSGSDGSATPGSRGIPRCPPPR